jgi:hypothetical protein|tara:strand:+ start:261 stop:740 length:480 start_codon:yes stop_codon:yes gene_type:complete
MNVTNFKNLHSDALGLGEKAGMISETIAKMFTNKVDKQSYLDWITSTAKDTTGGEIVQKKFAKEIKAVQNQINLTNTQKRMLTGQVTKEALTEKVRLIRACKPLLTKGKCTQSDIDNKQYFFITEKVTQVQHTFALDLKALMEKYGADNNDVKKELKIK